MTEQTTQILYLKGGNATRIVRDGPALRIKTKTRSDRLVPFRRLHRVHSFGNVQWQTEALMGCAEKQIAILFCRQDGTIRASLYNPAPRLHIELSNELDQLLEQQGSAQQIKHWFQTIHRNSQQQAQKKLARMLHKHQPETLQDMTSDYLKNHLAQAKWHKILQIIHAHMHAQILQRLQDYQLHPQSPMMQIQGISLPETLQQIVQTRIYSALLKKTRRIKQGQHPKRRCHQDIFAQATKWYQQLAPQIAENTDKLILQFHQYILELKHAPQTY